MCFKCFETTVIVLQYFPSSHCFWSNFSCLSPHFFTTCRRRWWRSTSTFISSFQPCKNLLQAISTWKIFHHLTPSVTNFLTISHIAQYKLKMKMEIRPGHWKPCPQTVHVLLQTITIVRDFPSSHCSLPVRKNHYLILRYKMKVMIQIHQYIDSPDFNSTRKLLQPSPLYKIPIIHMLQAQTSLLSPHFFTTCRRRRWRSASYTHILFSIVHALLQTISISRITIISLFSFPTFLPSPSIRITN